MSGTAEIIGPWPAGSAGTVSILEDKNITTSDFVTTHIYKGRVYWTVIYA